jgi:DNA-binding transcriptional MerR regulator
MGTVANSDVVNGQLPDKLYFKIGEAAEIVGVEAYVLRYWETEFAILKPVKSRSQQRLYRKRDMEVLLKIKKLLYDEQYTIAGAKRQLARSGDKDLSEQMSLQLPEARANESTTILRRVEHDLSELLRFLDESKTT